MSTLIALLCIAAVLLSFYLVLPFLTVFTSFFRREAAIQPARKERDFACVITAYRDNINLVKPIILSLLKQTHKKQIIYLVADDCNTNLPELPKEVVLIKPESKLASKVKSFILAIENFKRSHDAIVIFDPDNVAQPDFLSTLNNYMEAGFRAVQGERRAKNLDTPYACADATGEIYKNYIERYAPFLLGSSPTISGSGMAVETALFNEFLNSPVIQKKLAASETIIEDKLLQNFIVGKGLQIAYARESVIYDEKVSNAKQTQQQRSRWLYSYFVNVPQTLSLIARGIAGLNMNMLLFGLLASSLPMFILLFSALFLMVLSAAVSIKISALLATAILIFISNIFLTLVLSNAPPEIWQSIWKMPLFIYRQFLALFQMNRSRKVFLVTRNEKAMTLEEIEKNNTATQRQTSSRPLSEDLFATPKAIAER